MKSLFLLMINCDLKLQKMEQVVVICNALLALDPLHIKALLKRAQAHVFNGDLELAMKDLKQAKEQEPENPLIEEELKKVQLQLAEEEKLQEEL